MWCFHSKELCLLFLKTIFIKQYLVRTLMRKQHWPFNIFLLVCYYNNSNYKLSILATSILICCMQTYKLLMELKLHSTWLIQNIKQIRYFVDVVDNILMEDDLFVLLITCCSLVLSEFVCYSILGQCACWNRR